MKIFRIFVYGTLMKGYCNYNKYLDGHVISIKNAYIYGKMFHLYKEDCPAIVNGDEMIYGQVIDVVENENNSLLKQIDALETHFGNNSSIMYKRETKEVFYEDGTREMLGVYIFVNDRYLKTNNYIYVEGGNWDSFKKSN